MHTFVNLYNISNPSYHCWITLVVLDHKMPKVRKPLVDGRTWQFHVFVSFNLNAGFFLDSLVCSVIITEKVHEYHKFTQFRIWIGENRIAQNRTLGFAWVAMEIVVVVVCENCSHRCVAWVANTLHRQDAPLLKQRDGSHHGKGAHHQCSEVYRKPHCPSKAVAQLTYNLKRKITDVNFSFWYGNINVSNWSKWGGWRGIGTERSAEISPYLCWFFII